ncbi:MAG: M1 family aminopeptidase, partial [Anaerolineae bacterium]
YPPDLELEPMHLDIDVRLDLEAQACSGTATHTVEARRDGPTRLELNAVALSDVSVVDPEGNDLTTVYDGQSIAIEWSEPFAAGERRRAAVTYRVRKPASGLYFSWPTPEYPDTPRFVASDHETERARHWLPCVDQPSARPRLGFHLRADQQYTALANGEMVGREEHGDGTATTHWRLDFPCPSYLTCIAVGDFVRADDGEHGGAEIAYFGPPEFSAEDLRRSFGRTGEMLAWMAEKLGMALPFPKYYQFAAPGIGGAMENISLVSWDDAFVMDETLATEWTRLVDEINVHEMAHSYFGDAVVCRDYAHAWLKESWATYIEQVWFEDTRGADEAAYQYFRDAHMYFEEADNEYKRPLVTRTFSSSWDMYDSHLYPGGACRLSTLRHELGDDTFWAAVRDYLATFSGRVVETDDFRRVMEKHSGRSLGLFFDQWFHKPGYPDLKVTFEYDAKRERGTFVVVQKQAAPKDKKPAETAGGDCEQEPTFALKTDLGWVIDGEEHTMPVEVTEAKHTFIVPMAREPEQVRFDPGAKVLCKLELNPGEKMLRAQLTGARDAIGRMLAGRELCKTGTRENIEAVRDAYLAEPFWGVRAVLAAALGRAGVDSAIEVLAQLVEGEQDPLVIEHVMRAAAKYRDPRIREAVSVRLDGGLEYYRARAAAYQALGAQRDDAPVGLLLKAAETEGFGGIEQSGAFRALAASRSDQALPALDRACAYGATSNRARPAAAQSLGALGRLLEKRPRERAVDRLVELLREQTRPIRASALLGLQAMGATEAIGALEAARGPMSVQEQVRIDKAIAAIRQSAKPRTAAVEKELEELREKMRKLADSLEKTTARVEALDKAGPEGAATDAGATDDDGAAAGATGPEEPEESAQDQEDGGE